MEIRVLRYFSGCGKRGEYHAGSGNTSYHTAYSEPAALTAGGADGGKAVHTGNAKDHAYK